MGKANQHRMSFRRRAFTLIEVLIGLALAALVLGVVLNSVARDMLGISRAMPRYHAVLQASEALERKMELDAAQSGGQKSVNTTDPKLTGTQGEPTAIETKVAVVTADPRVEQVEIRVPYFRGNNLTVSAYRLRLRRQPRPKAAVAK